MLNRYGMKALENDYIQRLILVNTQDNSIVK